MMCNIVLIWMSVSWQIVLAAETSQQQIEQSQSCVTFALQKESLFYGLSNFIVCIFQFGAVPLSLSQQGHLFHCITFKKQK